MKPRRSKGWEEEGLPELEGAPRRAAAQIRRHVIPCIRFCLLELTLLAEAYQRTERQRPKGEAIAARLDEVRAAVESLEKLPDAGVWEGYRGASPLQILNVADLVPGGNR